MAFPLPPCDPGKDENSGDGGGLAYEGPHPGYFAIDVHNLKLGPYSYFERFQPIAKAGYSIFIYHITPLEAQRARREMGLPTLDAAREVIR